MKAPTPEQMGVAAMWLEINEGEEGEGDACHSVAAWLLKRADEIEVRTETTKAIREISRERGIPTSAIRNLMKRR